jgi:hypothetical protein
VSFDDDDDDDGGGGDDDNMTTTTMMAIMTTYNNNYYNDNREFLDQLLESFVRSEESVECGFDSVHGNYTNNYKRICSGAMKVNNGPSILTLCSIL